MKADVIALGYVQINPVPVTRLDPSGTPEMAVKDFDLKLFSSTN